MEREDEAPPPAARRAGGRWQRDPGVIHVRLLEGFEVTVHGRPVTLRSGASRLLALLALSPDGISRTRAAALLHPRAPERTAARNLRSSLSRLRAALRDALRDALPGALPDALPDAVEVEGGRLRLAEGVSVDVRAYEALARAVAAGDVPEEGGIDVRDFTDELLPGWHDDWVVGERDRLYELGQHAIEGYVGHEAAERRFTEAIDAILVALAREPFRESAMLVLLETVLAQGNQVKAAMRYLDFRSRLRAKMGVEP